MQNIKNFKKHENLKLPITLLCLIVTAIILSVVIRLNAIAIEEAKIREIWQTAESYCNTLFSDDIIKDDIANTDLKNCEDKLDLVFDQTATTNFRLAIQKAQDYIKLKSQVAQLFDENNIFKEETSEVELSDLEKLLTTLEKPYQDKLAPQIITARAELLKITEAKNTVLALFENQIDTNNFSQATISDSINRDQYDQAKKLVESLSQPNLKNKLLSALEIAENKVNEKEEAERQRLEAERLERERIRREQEAAARAREAAAKARETEIANAWHTMDIPYISQNRNGIYNGCEAASLLMSLQYKGFLRNKSFQQFVEEMPKSDNPHTGFYLSIYSLEPKSEAHWIDTTPLTAYGRRSSNSTAVYDLAGSDLSALQKEILNDNPVIIYMTYDFKDLKEIVNGVPTNLHVMVLSGYNKITNEYQITDPWTRYTGEYIFTIPGDRVETLYKKLGKRALVVRSQ